MLIVLLRKGESLEQRAAQIGLTSLPVRNIRINGVRRLWWPL